MFKFKFKFRVRIKSFRHSCFIDISSLQYGPKTTQGTRKRKKETRPYLVQPNPSHLLFFHQYLLTVDLCNVADKIEDTAGVTPLVVVPGDKLDKVAVQRDTGLGIKDR